MLHCNISCLFYFILFHAFLKILPQKRQLHEILTFSRNKLLCLSEFINSVCPNYVYECGIIYGTIHLLFSVLGIFSWFICRNRRPNISSEIRSIWVKCINATSFEAVSDYLCFSTGLNYFSQNKYKQHIIWYFSCMLWVLFPQSYPPRIFWLGERQPNLLVGKYS